MKKRNAKAVTALIKMLRQERGKVSRAEYRGEYFETGRDVERVRANQLQEPLDAAEARIADLEARPAAPSVEDVSNALNAYLYGPFRKADIICKLCGVDWDTAEAALKDSYTRLNGGDAS